MTATVKTYVALLLASAAIPAWGASIDAATSSRASGAHFIPGDVRAGMKVFFGKGCARCHSILGEGGNVAPDLARAAAGHTSATEFVAEMWNHAPAMWQRMRLENLQPAKFTEEEMTNLFAFIYAARSIDEPGDAQHGRKLLVEKGCLNCHSVEASGPAGAPRLGNWASHRNPVSWLQAMWNHGLVMRERMSASGLKWPHLEENDMPDIIAYVRSTAPESRTRSLLKSANPQNGRAVFREKGCASCHAIRGAGGGRAPDLGRIALPRTLGQLATHMWNHMPAMSQTMRSAGIAYPRFSNQEMADLLSFLFDERYFESSGYSDRGRQVFTSKGCAGCHGGRGPGPDLKHATTGISPVSFGVALWNHGPMMHERMQREAIPWPQFQAAEISDLIEFLAPLNPRRTASREGIDAKD